MYRFGLTFRNPATERQYMRWVIQRKLQRGDLEFLCVLFGLCSTAFLRHALDTDSWVYVAPSGLCCVYLVVEIAARRRMGVDDLTSRRTGMVLRTRIALSMVNWAISLNELQVPVTTLVEGCIANHIVPALMLAWCLRLKFQYQFPFQVLASTVQLLFWTKGRCMSLMESSGASLVTAIAGGLDRRSKEIMTAMYGHYESDPLICPCLHVMVWLHVFVILTLGSYVLWKIEWHSRREFVRRLPPERRIQEGLKVGFQDTWFIILMHVFLFAVAFAVIWELDFFIVGAIVDYGT